MNIQLLETSARNRQMYDLSTIISDVTWTTSLNSQPSKLEFSMLDDSKVYLRSGDVIELKVDGKNVFKGKAFIRNKKENAPWKITAYDLTRYLSSEDTLLFNASSASARFRTICQTQGMAHKVLDNATYNCPAVVEDKHTYYSMLEDAIDITRREQGARFGFWDNYGTLEFFLLNRQITNIVIGDNSLLTGYEFEGSIDDAVNSVKVMREDRESGKREIYTASHKGNIDLWGKLQIVETNSDADLNSTQLQNQAKTLLAEKNKEIKTLRLTSIGHLSLRAGNSFILRLAELEREGIGKDSLALITSCTHRIGSDHTMDLEIEVVA